MGDTNRASATWILPCAWCPAQVYVGGRGARGGDPGAGVEAAKLMQEHVQSHGKTWAEYLSRLNPADRDLVVASVAPTTRTVISV